MTFQEGQDKVKHVVPNERQNNDLIATRTAALDFLCVLEDRVPDGREKSIAITKIEEALMWANKGITHTE